MDDLAVAARVVGEVEAVVAAHEAAGGAADRGAVEDRLTDVVHGVGGFAAKGVVVGLLAVLHDQVEGEPADHLRSGGREGVAQAEGAPLGPATVSELEGEWERVAEGQHVTHAAGEVPRPGPDDDPGVAEDHIRPAVPAAAAGVVLLDARGDGRRGVGAAGGRDDDQGDVQLAGDRFAAVYRAATAAGDGEVHALCAADGD